MTSKKTQSASGANDPARLKNPLDAESRTWETDSSFSDEERPMTLCIAADCWIEDHKPCVAFCTDTRAERGGVFHELVGSEDVWKIREIGKNIALVSGAETPADRLLALCDGAIKNFGKARGGDDADLLVDGLLRDLETQAEARKKYAANHWLQFEYGLSLDHFIANQKQFDAELARGIWQRINSVDLETDILICGFQDDDPVIVKLDRFGKAHWETNYSAVGAGSDIAYSFLSQHDWDDSPSVLQCAYYLLEAKTAAERNRHVGEYTYLRFLMPDGKQYVLADKVFNRIDAQIERRRTIKTPTFTMDMLEELTDDAPPKPETKQ